MSSLQTKSGFVTIDHARLYYETAGQGLPLVMIHAGVADSRQWNNEFTFFARNHLVVRNDMRGYGKSEPVDGDFSHLEDLAAVLSTLELDQPVVLIGCSMGGGLALDFALTHPSRVRALIMVGSGPSGLELDVPRPAKFDEVEKAFEAGELDRVAELETQIWFDGMGRTPEQVNPAMRKLAYEMNRLALSHEGKGLGQRLPNSQAPAFDRLGDLKIPVLVIVGAHDTPYILAAADHMIEKIPAAQKVTIEDAAHLANMDQPDEFQAAVANFLEGLSY